MSTNKKTRADSVLGTLPEERQAEIAEHAAKNSLADTVAWLKADGLKISSGNLSRWLSQWRLSQIFARSNSRAERVRELLLKSNPQIAPEELDRQAALMFQLAAIEEGDSKTWLEIASARQKAKTEKVKAEQREKVISQNDRKLSLLEKKAAQADRAKGILTDKELSEEEKKLKMHALFGLR